MDTPRTAGPGAGGKAASYDVVLPNNPFEPQIKFHEAAGHYRYRLYGGARGGGKSRALRWDAIYHCLTYPGTACLILRKNYPELYKNQIGPILDELPPQLYHWNSDQKVLSFANGSHIDFGFLDTEDDCRKYQGAEYNLIYFDEVTQFTYPMWAKLMGSNRATKGCKPSMAAAGNPGGIGHAWVKALWITKDREQLGVCEGLQPNFYDPAQYFFQKSTVYDNPYLMAADPDYEKDLRRLPDNLRAAWLEGNWDLVAGQYFDCWTDDCVVKPDFIAPWHPRWISIDWGFIHEAVALWHTSDPEGRSVVTYREFAVNRITPTELAHAIGEMTEGETIDQVYLSPDAYHRRTTERTIAIEMGEILSQYSIPAPLKAEDARVNGWALMFDFLKSGRWKISKECKLLLRTIPLAQRDEKKPEDIIKFVGDDSIDAARYGIASRWLKKAEPRDVEIARRMQGVTNGTHQFMVMRRLEAEMRNRDQPLLLGRRVN